MAITNITKQVKSISVDYDSEMCVYSIYDNEGCVFCGSKDAGSHHGPHMNLYLQTHGYHGATVELGDRLYKLMTYTDEWCEYMRIESNPHYGKPFPV